MENQAHKRGLSGSTLKIIAIVTMLIDHTGAALLETSPNYHMNPIISDVNYVMRMIGRISFPIFCFLLVEGFLHTSNIKKYATRLLIFAFLSEIPFDLAFAHKIFDFSYQNVFFTLFIGLLTLIAIKHFETNQMMKVFAMLAGYLVATLLRTDYAGFGVVFILLLYFLHDNKLFRNIICSISLLWEYYAILAFIPISFYNGKRGIPMKYFFYLFYPVHLLLLYGVYQLIY